MTQGYYEVWYLDMNNYGRPSWGGSPFRSAQAALAHARSVIDDYLVEAYMPGTPEEGLYRSFMMFGEDCLVVAKNGAPELKFSGLEYVKERCREICSPGEGECDHSRPAAGYG